jgi:hypothetical protein
MEASPLISESRVDDERRQFSWRTVFFGFIRSRRHAHRRSIDDDVVFLDWHHPWLFFLATGTMLLSCADAFLTLQLIDSTKLALTAFGIFVLVFLAKSKFLNRFRTGIFLTIFFSFYACLVCYEVVNLLRML